LAPYSRASFRSRLRDEVLPLLLGSETQPS
jgi:hypothetical protein